MLSNSIDVHSQNDWDEYLPVLQFAYNASVHSSTGLQPFCLHFDREPRTLLDMVLSRSEKVNKPNDCLKEMKASIRHQVALAQQQMSKSMLKQKQECDEKGNFRYYEKGELVLLREYKCPKGLRCERIDGQDPGKLYVGKGK